MAEGAVKAGGFDFGNAKVQERIDGTDGAWMHIAHPVSGEPLYDDDERAKPCRVKVLSVDSKAYAQATRSIDVRLLRTAAGGALEEASKASTERAAAAITAFENVWYEDRYLDAKSKADRLLWVGLAPDFVTQVQRFAARIDNFFDSGSGS